MAEKNEETSKDLLLSEVFIRAARYWWLVTILMIAGGVAGLLIALLQKPLYESTSQVTTVIDFAYANRLKDYEEDFLLSAIGDIITSDEVIQATSTAAVTLGLFTNPNEVTRGMTASRQGYRWQLSTRFHDARASQKVNQLWLDSSMRALENLRQQSIKALAQVNTEAQVQACFQQSVVLEPVSSYCTVDEIRALLTQSESTNNATSSLSLLNRLLISRISFQATREAELPDQPVHIGLNTATLAGAAIGLLTAIILFVLGYPRVLRAGCQK